MSRLKTNSTTNRKSTSGGKADKADKADKEGKKNRAAPAAGSVEKAKVAGTAPSAALAFGSLEHILLVLDRLDAVYGYDEAPADIYATGEPLDGLLLTLLSQNTNDRNRDMAYDALREVYPTWREVAALDPQEIARLIRPAGLGAMKSVRMKALLQTVHDDFGDYSLVAMKDWEPAAVRDYLSNMQGIGPKTVACVMIFDLDMPAFPVDTHVARISRRLGWVPEKMSAEKIQDFLEAIVPPERCRGGHLNMITHGRRVCHARKPECGVCVADDICKYNLETNISEQKSSE